MLLLLAWLQFIPELNTVGVSRARQDPRVAAALRASVASELLQEGPRKRIKRGEQKNPLEQDQARRSSNRVLCVVLDSQLQAVGLSLEKLRVQNPMRAVLHGEKRVVNVGESSLVHIGADGIVVSKWKLASTTFRERWSLHLCADQGPKSLPLQSFLQHAGLFVTCEADILHRLHNAWSTSISSSTMQALRVEFRQVYQLRGGPFRSQAFNSLLSETVSVLKTLRGSECVLFEHFYAEYCTERGVETAADYGTLEHEDSMYKLLVQDLEKETVEGAKLSRWFTWETRTERMMESTFTGMKFLLLFTGMYKQMWRTWSETPLAKPDSDGSAGLPQSEEKHGLEDQDDEGDAPACASTGAEPMPVQKVMRAGGNKSIVAALKTLAPSLPTRVAIGIALVSRPLRRFFAELQKDLKTERGTIAAARQLAQGHLRSVMRETGRYFTSEAFAGSLGFVADHSSSVQNEEDSKLAQSMMRLILHSLAELACLDLGCTSQPPRCFLRLLSDSKADVVSALDELKLTWEALLRLEEQCAGGEKDCQHFVRDLVWPCNQYIRHVFCYLELHGWQPDRHLLESLSHYGSSWLSTLIVENTFRVAGKTPHTHSGTGSVLNTWYDVWQSESLSTEYGRPRIKHPDSSKQSVEVLTDTFFATDLALESSLSTDCLDSMLSQPPPFASLSASELNAIGVRTLALRELRGDWEPLSRLWLSRLVQPGHIIGKNDEAKTGFLVLKTTNFGNLGLRLELRKVRGKSAIAPFFEGSRDIEWFGITSIDPWKAVGVRVATPGQSWGDKSQGVIKSLVVLPEEGRSSPLLNHAVRGGLQGWGLTMLRKLVGHVQTLPVKGGSKSKSSSIKAKPNIDARTLSEVDCLKWLAGRVLEDDSESMMEGILRNRNLDPSEHLVSASILSELETMAKNESSDDDADGAADLAVYRDAVERIHVQRLKALKPSARSSRAKPTSTSSTSALPALPALSWEGSDITVECARTYFPPESHPICERSFYHRWKVTAPYLAQMHTCTFGGTRGITHNVALRRVLIKAWEGYTRKTGISCPHELDVALQ
eukprot:6478594-Amphidinium_carterae.1